MDRFPGLMGFWKRAPWAESWGPYIVTFRRKRGIWQGVLEELGLTSNSRDRHRMVWLLGRRAKRYINWMLTQGQKIPRHIVPDH